jgi:hypothetical protein
MPIIWHRINLLHWLLNADYQVAPKWRLATGFDLWRNKPHKTLDFAVTA